MILEILKDKTSHTLGQNFFFLPPGSWKTLYISSQLPCTCQRGDSTHESCFDGLAGTSAGKVSSTYSLRVATKVFIIATNTDISVQLLWLSGFRDRICKNTCLPYLILRDSLVEFVSYRRNFPKDFKISQNFQTMSFYVIFKKCTKITFYAYDIPKYIKIQILNLFERA